MNQQKGSTTSIVIAIILIAAIVGIVVYSMMHKSASTVPAGVTETLDETQSTTLPTQTITTTPMDTNNARVAKDGDVLVMNYTGRLTNGTVFDSNVDPKFNHVQPFEFTLGAHQVIEGWDEGLVGMKVGEKKTLTIPPEKGYGATGQGPIPPNSTLIFDVELVAIK